MALKMFRGGKLKILPSVARQPRNHRKPEAALEADMMPAYPNLHKPAAGVQAEAISYYPGCSLEATGIEYHLSTKAIAKN